MSLRILWLLVPLAPAVFAYGFDALAAAFGGRPGGFQPGSHTLVLRAVLVSLPFFTLAVIATYARKAATPAWTAALGRAVRVGLLLNLLLWSVYHLVAAGDAGGRPGVGGLAVGVLALLSPVWVGYAMYRTMRTAKVSGPHGP